jgi:hypothetical protein
MCPDPSCKSLNWDERDDWRCVEDQQWAPLNSREGDCL